LQQQVPVFEAIQILPLSVWPSANTLNPVALFLPSHLGKKMMDFVAIATFVGQLQRLMV
jgi:hypothetical protein